MSMSVNSATTPSTNNNRQKILNAASQLIAEKGVAHTTISDIVERVGISKGTLHYYYKTKNELIYDITIRHLDHLTTYWLDELTRTTPESRLSRLLKETLEDFVHAEGPGRLNLYLIHDAVTGNEQLRECFRKKYENWRQSITQVLGRAFPDNPGKNEMLSYITIALIDGLIIQWLLGSNDIPFERIAEYLLD